MRIEAELGNDLTLVRSLNERAGGSPSAFETDVNEIHRARRETVRQLSAQKSFKRWLSDAVRNPSGELHTSAELLSSQPALADLVSGLAQAKQDLSEAEGKYQPRHPDVKGGREKVASIKRQIKKSMQTVIGGLDEQIKTFENQIELYDGMLEENAARLMKVSSKRVPYAASISQLEKQTEEYGEVSSRLARMQSRKNASASIKLLTRIGEPLIGTRPDGMGKRALSLIGGIAGLFIGLGMVMIVAPPFQPSDEETVPNSQSQPAASSVRGNKPVSEASSVAQTQEKERQIEEAGLHRLGDYVPRRTAETVPFEAEDEPTPTPVPPTIASAPSNPVPPNPVPPNPAQASTDSGVVASGVDNSIEAAVASAMATVVPQVQTQPPQLAQPSAVPQPPVVAQPSAVVKEEVIMVDSSSTVIPTDSELRPLASVSSVENPVSSGYATSEVTSQNMGQQFSSQPQAQTPQPELVAVSEPVSSIPGSSSPVSSSGKPKAAAKTLAAIFSNMPQPRNDVGSESVITGTSPSEVADPVAIADQIEELANQATDSTVEQEQTKTPTTPLLRESVETIELEDEQRGPTDSIPLQRRTEVRPVDLAKVEDSPTSQASIDNVFSQLKPPSQEIQGRLRASTDSNPLDDEA